MLPLLYLFSCSCVLNSYDLMGKIEMDILSSLAYIYKYILNYSSYMHITMLTKFIYLFVRCINKDSRSKERIITDNEKGKQKFSFIIIRVEFKHNKKNLYQINIQYMRISLDVRKYIFSL